MIGARRISGCGFQTVVGIMYIREARNTGAKRPAHNIAVKEGGLVLAGEMSISLCREELGPKLISKK